MEAKRQRRSQSPGNRKPSVYDAVAGRLSIQGSLKEDSAPTSRDTSNRAQKAVPPEEILFRRRGAPIRYEEDDMYFQNRRLTKDQVLPDSDLLKVLHAYAADFYAATTSDQGRTDYKSLDGTALLALGMLLEESAAEMLGETGDLALVENKT